MSKTHEPTTQESTAFRNVIFTEPLTIDLDERDRKIAKVVKDAAALHAKNTKKRKEAAAVEAEAKGELSPAAKEYRELRKQLFNLKTLTKSTEQKVNNAADEVKHWQRNIEDLKKRKAAAVAEDRLGDERFCERQLAKAEDELLDAREKLTKEQRFNHGVVRDLRNWQAEFGPRLDELAKEFSNKLAA